MAQIIIIEDESRIANQMRGFIKEMDKDSQVQLFESLDIFERQYLLGKTREQTTEGTEDEDQRLTYVDLVIFKANCIKGDVKKWVANAREKLKAKQFWPEGRVTRFIAVKYDDDGKPKSNFLTPLIDDLIALPLDRLLFLQKLEVVLSLPNFSSPSYLFQQDIASDEDRSIEIAKQTRIQKLNDVGLAVRNPIPLRPGTPASFHFTLPGMEDPLYTRGKVVRSEDNPENPNEKLVYFTFFGPERFCQTEIRKYLSQQSNFNAFKSEDPQQFTFNPDNIFLDEEQRRIKQVVVIDPDAQVCASIVDFIRKDFGQTNVVACSTRFQFKSKYLDANQSEKNHPPATADDFFAAAVSFTINTNDDSFVQWDTDFLENDDGQVVLLGHDLKSQLKGAKSWKSLFSPPMTNGLITELLEMAAKGLESYTLMSLRDNLGEDKKCGVKIEPLSDHQVKFTLTPPSKEEMAQQSASSDSIDHIDLLIVDESLIPIEPNEWLQEIHKEMLYSHKIHPNKKVPVIVLGNTDGDPQRFFDSDTFGYIRKPLDTKLTMVSMANALKTPFTQYQLDNLGWSEALIKVNVGKPAQLKSISEFGATIVQARPIAPGAPIFLHHGIYENAPDGNLLARSYAYKEDPEQRGTYLISLLYFGINDSFLKYTRSWIREKYAEKKEQSN